MIKILGPIMDNITGERNIDKSRELDTIQYCQNNIMEMI